MHSSLAVLQKDLASGAQDCVLWEPGAEGTGILRCVGVPGAERGLVWLASMGTQAKVRGGSFHLLATSQPVGRLRAVRWRLRWAKGLPPWPPCGPLHPPMVSSGLPASKKPSLAAPTRMAHPPLLPAGLSPLGPVCRLGGGETPTQGGSSLGVGPSLVLMGFSAITWLFSKCVHGWVVVWASCIWSLPSKKGSQNHWAR